MSDDVRIRIAQDWSADGIAVQIARRFSRDAIMVMHVGAGGWNTWDTSDPAILQEPSFRLPDDVGRALLDALTRHYQGASDTHTVREDMLHERKRVDDMLMIVSKIALAVSDVDS